MQLKTCAKYLVRLKLLAYLLFGSCVYADNITVNPGIKYQTMSGWEVTAFAMEDNPAFDNFKDQLFDMLVNDAGFNRVQLPVRSGVENNTDYWSQYQNGSIAYATWRANRYSTSNDNNDPATINRAGFKFSELDNIVDKVILPIKQRVEANNEKLHINLTYVAFTAQNTQGGGYHHDDPAEYAEFILASFLHLQQKYGWTPDAVEVSLEPDNVDQWDGALLGRAMVAAATRLQAAGFRPGFIAPSNTSMAAAITYFDNMIAVPGALQYLTEFAYHRYAGVSITNLQAIANRAVQHDLQTSMLEWWDSKNSHHVLHEDLKTGLNSAWQQGGVVAPCCSPTAAYWVNLDNPARPVITIGNVTKFTRQYYKYVRAGAVRTGVTSDNSDSDPLAFINADGKYVVVIKTQSGRSLTVGGLPAGVYGIKYTTQNAYDVDHAYQTLAPGESLDTSIPSSGVITVYAVDDIPPGPPRNLKVN